MLRLRLAVIYPLHIIVEAFRGVRERNIDEEGIYVLTEELGAQGPQTFMLQVDEDKDRQPALYKNIQNTKLKGLPSESVVWLLNTVFLIYMALSGGLSSEYHR